MTQSNLQWPSRDELSNMDDSQYQKIQSSFQQIAQGTEKISTKEGQEQIQQGVELINETLQSVR